VGNCCYGSSYSEEDMSDLDSDNFFIVSATKKGTFREKFWEPIYRGPEGSLGVKTKFTTSKSFSPRLVSC
jgi:hypothetical protein